MRKIPSFVALILLVSACNGGDKKSDLPKVFAKDYVVRDNSGLNITASNLGGSGTIALNTPLTSAAKGSRNLELVLSLEDQGSVTLMTFADKRLEHSLPITIARAGSAVSVSYIDASGGTLSADLNLEDASGPFRLSLDIHNQEASNHTHLIIWQDSEDAPHSSNAYLVNDEEAAAGLGNFLGIKVDKAQISELSFDGIKSSFE